MILSARVKKVGNFQKGRKLFYNVDTLYTQTISETNIWASECFEGYDINVFQS